MVIEIRQYIDSDGKNHFEEWFQRLNAPAAARAVTALARLEAGNWSNVKGVGSGVYEYRIDFGPGYRLYFGKDGEHIIILLTGGSKKHQQKDIENAKQYWTAYKDAQRTRR